MLTTVRSAMALTCLATMAIAADLPVQRVTLYSSGVACYERSGEVTGDAAVDMPFKTEQINDILKSLVLIDLGGGRVEPVVYASQDPLEKSLKAFGIDLTGEPTLRELLAQLRGVEIELLLETQVDPIIGRILGAESQQVVDKHGTTSLVEFVSLGCTDGLRRFKLAEIRSARILDDKLDAELTQALELLAGARDVGKKSVALRFAGDGTRRVLAAYVLEAPIWKTSYRLVLSDDEAPLLQGWAMVDNTTDEDWTGVGLTLVSGRPISFVQDLYSPLYVPRPEIKPELYASLRPQSYAGDTDDEVGEMEGMRAKAKTPRSMRRRGDSNAFAMEDTLHAGVAAAAPAISATNVGVASMAQASDVGELFKYAIQTPVTIGRQKSAMLPIVNQPVECEKLSIFNQRVHDKYPLNGLHLTNTTELNLMQGPVTVFDEGVYAGDAQLDDLSPSERRLISYAMDLDREVVVESDSTPDQIVSVRIAKGTMIVTNKYVKKRHYSVKNKTAAARTVMIEHPYDSGWSLLEPAQPDERTASLYRFKVKADGGKTTALTVREERISDQHLGLRGSGADTFAIYLRSKVISQEVRRALEQIQKMRTDLDRTEREANRLKDHLRSITEEQDRLRANIQAVERGSDLYRRYIAKLETQETDIERTQIALAETATVIERQRRELEDYLLNLSVE